MMTTMTTVTTIIANCCQAEMAGPHGPATIELIKMMIILNSRIANEN
jgi:hypothetical protein